MAIHIGTSGWGYAHRAGVLYPEGLPAERRLDYYISRFATAELNPTMVTAKPDANAGPFPAAATGPVSQARPL